MDIDQKCCISDIEHIHKQMHGNLSVEILGGAEECRKNSKNRASQVIEESSSVTLSDFLSNGEALRMKLELEVELQPELAKSPKVRSWIKNEGTNIKSVLTRL